MSDLFKADGSSGSTALPTNNVTRADLQGVLQAIKPIGNTAIGQLEGIATAGLVTVIDPVAKTLSTSAAVAAAAAETSAILTTTGAVDVTKKTTKFNAASGAFTFTLPNGSYDGQEVALRFVNGASTATWTAAGLANLLGFTGIILSAIAHTCRLKWDATGGKWAVEGGNALLS